MSAPVLLQPIPSQVMNERAAYGPFDLKNYIQAAEEGSSVVRFYAELDSGEALPKGMICTEDGILTGIPGKETHGNYQVMVTAENDEGSIQVKLTLTIKPSLAGSTTEYADQLKAQVWDALGKNLPIPDLSELYDRPVTALDIYYLLERWGTLTIWDAFNLDPAGEKHLLTLEGASPHYYVYDRGSCLIASPVDLFSHERTLEDGLRTARAMAAEVYKRQWTIQMAGFDKFIRAAWIEVQHLGDKYGKRLEVINFNPTYDEVKLYTTQALSRGME
jgi:hypothetical protein